MTKIPKMMRPCGCDTFVAFPPATKSAMVVFGKNSDRPQGEGQSIRRYPRKVHTEKEEVQCTYIRIPQAATTNAVLLSQIGAFSEVVAFVKICVSCTLTHQFQNGLYFLDWMWGVEMGANEHGVVIGNEAVWTREPCDGRNKALLGMDLVRLGLERGNTAREALEVITTLLEEHGQGECVMYSTI